MKFNLLQILKMPVLLVGVLVASIALSGCAGSDVELNIPGLRGVKLGGKKAEKKVAVRGGLVIPPSTKKLPDPNKIAARSQQEEQAWPDDPDQRKKKLAALKRKEAKNRRNGYDKDGNPDFEAMRDGGSGSGQPGLLDNLLNGRLFKKDDEEEEE